MSDSPDVSISDWGAWVAMVGDAPYQAGKEITKVHKRTIKQRL